jgi:hypothetical protein
VDQVGEICLAQHKADVGVGNEHSVAVDHVGASALADVDARNDVPHELQVDLCQQDPTVGSDFGSGDRQVRLGGIAEMDGAVRHRLCPRGSEQRVARVVDLASDHVQSHARDAHLFAPQAVDIHELGDGWRLPKQSLVLVGALVERASADSPERGRNARHVAVDLSQELLDARRGVSSLRLFEASDGSLMIVVHAVQLGQARREHRTQDKRPEYQRVLTTQRTLARHHATTSEAWSSRVCGSTRLRAWAVRRLTVNPKTSARSTGRSAGRAPVRILST